jgi:toxin CcdB
MAKFDVYRLPDGTIVLDCQSEILSYLNTRFVAPLVDPEDSVALDRRLTPLVAVGDEKMRLLAHFATAVPANLLRERIGAVVGEDYVIAHAFDMLLSGY